MTSNEYVFLSPEKREMHREFNNFFVKEESFWYKAYI